MKTMFGKYLALIVTLLIISGCPNVFEPPVSEKPPAGEGYFSLVINGVNTGRTILPTTVQNDFLLYTLEFFHTGTMSNPVTRTERNNSNLSEPILLSTGTWDLYVIAYMDETKTKPAAQGHLKDIKIGSTQTVSQSITLTAIIDEGEGVFKWDIGYPSNVSVASMTITPFDSANGTPETTLYFIGGTPLTAQADSLALNAGYYRVAFNLSIGELKTERKETLHIYKNIESSFAYAFTENQFTYIIVTSDADSGAGSLRQAIIDAPAYSTIIIDDSVKTILLRSQLTINRSLVIAGNGVTITRDPSLEVSSRFFRIEGTTTTVTISRIHFKDSMTTNSGAVIFSSGANLTLESCIFSGNQATASTYGTNYDGGVIYNYSGALLFVRGCTFYGNSATGYGGVIANDYNCTAVLEGNLFYGNTAGTGYPVVAYSSWTSTSGSYNMVDVPLGNGNNQSGWNAGTGDTTFSSLGINDVPFDVNTFVPIFSLPFNIPSVSEDFPLTDFYGNVRTIPGIPGAVAFVNMDIVPVIGISDVPTSAIAGTPLTLTGTVSPSNATSRAIIWSVKDIGTTGAYINGNTMNIMAAGTVIITATIPNGVSIGTDYKQDFTILVSSTDILVTSDADSGPGSLRQAIVEVLANGRITIDDSVKTISLRSRLTIDKNLVIAGNGVTITRDPSWTSSSLSQLLYTSEETTTITISRVHFKNGMASDNGAAIYKVGSLILESCIFSGNRTTASSARGGAIHNNTGPLSVKGCTFYGNSSGGYGGAIVSQNGTVTLEGNLFYGNTAGSSYPVVYRANSNSTIISRGYNVVDVPLGTGSTQSGWTAGTGDATFSSLGISGVPFNVDTFVPVFGLYSYIPSVLENFPLIDFYGNTRTFPSVPGAVAFVNMNIVPVTSISNVPVSAIVGTPLALTSTVSPSNATNQTITWSVYNAGTTGATISGNILNTTNAGSVTVTATIAHGKAPNEAYTQNFTINVLFIAVSEITDVPTSVMAGLSLTLSGTVLPGNANNKAITWSIYNTGTTGATITSGNILNTTNGGTVIVTATVANGTAPGTAYTQNFTITVVPFIAVSDIVSVPTTAYVGIPITLNSTVLPSNATNQNITWSFYAGTTGATITDGNVLNTTGAGTVLVRATIPYGLSVYGAVYTKDFTITVKTMLLVTSDADSGPGSLRQAITDVSPNGTIFIDSNVRTISLSSPLSTDSPSLIGKSFTIEGNGVTITRAASWTTVDASSHLLYIVSTGTITIRRIHFKDGRATIYGGAIYSLGDVTLESCIFSGNKSIGGITITGVYSDGYGGAIYNLEKMIIKGCTFYGNEAGNGGAISTFSSYDKLILEGNLFYGNTASLSYPTVYGADNVISKGYNVVDVPLGNGNNQSGWNAGTGDTTFSSLGINGVPFDVNTFNPVSSLRSRIPSAPEDFQLTDFYGNYRTYPGAPGAVKGE